MTFLKCVINISTDVPKNSKKRKYEKIKNNK